MVLHLVIKLEINRIYILLFAITWFPNIIFSQTLPSGFVDLKKEIPDINIDIRYATNNNFVGEKLDGYELGLAWGLKEMGTALKKVQEELKANKLSLKIFDAYRPIQAEKHMIRWAMKNNKNQLLGVYIPLKVRTDSLYGHTSGNMIDLTLVDETGKELNMGTDFDEFSEKAHTLNAKGDILENRNKLQAIMKKHGFKNYPKEWWHFTFLAKTGKALDVPLGVVPNPVLQK